MRISTEAIEVLQKAQTISSKAGIMDGMACKYLLMSLTEHESVGALLVLARVSALDIRRKVAVAHRDPTEVPYPSSHHKLKSELASMRANEELSADEYCKDAAKLIFDRRMEEASSPVWKALNYAHNEARARGDSIGVVDPLIGTLQVRNGLAERVFARFDLGLASLRKLIEFTYSYANFPLGELTQVQEGGKTPTTLSYSEPCGLIQTITAPKPGTAGSGQTVTSSWTYDGLGNVLTETGPGNNAATSITTTFNYTTDGAYSQVAAIRQPLTKTDNLGHVTHMRYDARANLTAVSDALGNETDLTYNLANQNVSILFAATGSSGTGRASFTNSYLYADGPKTAESQNNESNVQVFQIVHSLGGEAEELGRSGSTQSYAATYDAIYRPVTISDGNSHATRIYYNSAGYAWKTEYPNGDIIRYTGFNDLGQPTQRTDGRSVVTNYSYTDDESKLTDIRYPASTGINVHLTYDAYGRMDSVSDGSGSHAYSFDDRGNRLTDTTTYTGLSALTLTTSYNDDGSKASLTLPDSSSFSYSYDAAARVVGLTNPSGQSWAWSYLDNNWLSEQDTNGQIITLPTRNARGAVTDITNERNNMAHTLLSEYGVSYGSNMTLGSVTASIPAAPTSFSGTTSYTHDTKLQLNSETSARGGGYNFSNGFDSAGNATTFKGGSNTYNSSNQNTAWTHDGNGNPTSYAGSTLTFDAENRMTAYGSVLTAGYRADGLRAWKTNSSGTTYYVYDGDQPVEELDGSGNKTAVVTFGPHGVLARTTSSRTLLYTFDALGQMAQQIDASTGNIIASYLFDAWGARQVSTSDPTAASDPYSGYNTVAGYIADWETGLQLLGHRYYDPATGRFLNRDPIGMAGGVNVYAYLNSSPLSGTDPSGCMNPVLGVLISCGAAVGGGLIGTIIGNGLGQPNIQAGLCSAGVSCISSIVAAVLTAGCAALLWCEPFLVVVAGIAGCLAGIVATVLSGLYCGDKLCAANTRPKLFCIFLASMMSCIMGALSGIIGGASPDDKTKFADLIINALAGLIGGGTGAACATARPPNDHGDFLPEFTPH